jgi:hypothetical protein
MIITKQQLRRIIKEQISKEPTGQVEVEWDFFMDGDEDGWNDMSYEDQLASEGIPGTIEIKPNIMAEYQADAAEYGASQAESVITDWLSDEYGWLSQGWSWV